MLVSLWLGLIGAIFFLFIAPLYELARDWWRYRRAMDQVEEARKTHARCRKQLIPYWVEEEAPPAELVEEYEKAEMRWWDGLSKASSASGNDYSDMRDKYPIDTSKPETRRERESREWFEQFRKEMDEMEELYVD